MALAVSAPCSKDTTDLPAPERPIPRRARLATIKSNQSFRNMHPVFGIVQNKRASFAPNRMPNIPAKFTLMYSALAIYQYASTIFGGGAYGFPKINVVQILIHNFFYKFEPRFSVERINLGSISSKLIKFIPRRARLASTFYRVAWKCIASRPHADPAQSHPSRANASMISSGMSACCGHDALSGLSSASRSMAIPHE